MAWYPNAMPTSASPEDDPNGLGDASTKVNGSVFRPRAKTVYADELRNIIRNIVGLAETLGMPTGSGTVFAQLATLAGTVSGLASGKQDVITAGTGLSKVGATIAVAVGGIGSTLLAASAVIEEKLASSAVTESKIAVGAVTGPKLATNSVASSAIVDGNVTEAKLASGAVTTSKIGAGAVTTAKIASEAVTTSEIGPAAVTGSKVADNAITDAKLRDSAAVSVIGRSANSSGDPADIAAGVNDRVLARVSDAISWVQVTFAMLTNGTALSVVGRSANSAGVYGDIAASNDGEVLRRSGTSIGFGTTATAGIADNAITDAKLRDSAALSVIGRSANSSGDPADIAAANDHEVMRRSGATLAFGRLVGQSLAAWPAAAMYVNAAQSISDSSVTTLNFDTSEFAIGGSNAPTVQLASDRIDIALAGLYRLTLRCGIDTTSTTGFLLVIVRVNGVDASEVRIPNAGAIGTTAECSTIVSLAAADQITAQVYQSNGGARNTNTEVKRRPRLTVEYVGPAT